MDYSSHQNPPSQPYNPSGFQPYNPQYPQQQQYSSYYPNPYPQTHQQWNHHNQQPPIHPPGVPSQPFGYQLPQRPDGVVAVAQLLQQAQNCYPQPQGFRPVIGGPVTYTGPVAYPAPGPSRLPKRAGQSLDRGGGRRGGGQGKGGGRDKTKRDRLMTKNYPERSPIDSAGVGRCELCKVDCGGMDKLKQHESGKRHKRNLKKLETDENWKPVYYEEWHGSVGNNFLSALFSVLGPFLTEDHGPITSDTKHDFSKTCKAENHLWEHALLRFPK